MTLLIDIAHAVLACIIAAVALWGVLTLLIMATAALDWWRGEE